jgi:hypothetical protein
MKYLALLFFIMLFGLSGCGKVPGNSISGSQNPPDKLPEDFSLSMFWFTGIMPDSWMQYTYEIQIGPGSEGRFLYRSSDQSREMDNLFTTSAEDLETLYLFLLDNNAFSTDRQPGEPIDGGPDISLVFTAAGSEYGFSELSELSEGDRNLVYAIKEQLELLVPAELWDEMKRLQLECETENY